MSETALPASLAEIAEDFRSATNDLKLQLLLEFSDELPGLPDRYAGHLDQLERVDECQSPLFLTVEVGDGASLDDRVVSLFFDAPAEAPTTPRCDSASRKRCPPCACAAWSRCSPASNARSAPRRQADPVTCRDPRHCHTHRSTDVAADTPPPVR